MHIWRVSGRLDNIEESGAHKDPIGSASASSVESYLGRSPRIYFDNVTLTLHRYCNVTLASLKPCQHNNKWVQPNEVYVFSIAIFC